MTYAAFIRSIMPTNPNTRNDKLKALFESLGFCNVIPVISSGNVIFETEEDDVTKLESKIENAMKDELNFVNSAFVRSKKDLEHMFKKDPFKGGIHSRESYLVVTFLKTKPFQIYSNIDVSATKTPKFMADLEKKYGKQNTTRTWKTIERILKKM